MTLAPQHEETEGISPPESPPLSAFCDNCGKPTGVRNLVAVCVQPSQSSEPQWLLLCGGCYVDGECLP